MRTAEDFLNENVEDPTDFPPEAQAPGLRSVDSVFRCAICGEVFDAPVTITCGHCFCSKCVRDSMVIKAECPACRKSADERHIRPNPVMEEAVSAWKNARPFILQLLQTVQELSNHDEPARKRARLDRSPSIEVISSKPSSSASRSSASAGLSTPMKSRKGNSGAEDDIATPRGRKQPSGSMNASSSNHALSRDSMVECPICQRQVVFERLNSHMDSNCADKAAPSKESTASQWSKLLGGVKQGDSKGKRRHKGQDNDDDDPLPKASYHTLKDRQLKSLLQDLDLSTTGERSHWEQRHEQWIILHNANLDRAPGKRKTKAELKRELKKWEEEVARRGKVVVADLDEYQRTHKGDFARLVAQAKANQAKVTRLVESADSDAIALGTSSSEVVPADVVMIPETP